MPLSAEDQTVQSMPDASPTKWHLAHTTWFFETFVLRPHARDYRVFDPAYEYLFNSYYEAVGPRHPRPQRGMITRPGVAEILAYRRHVSGAMASLLTESDSRIDQLVELGLHHEQQHQELLLMDAKHLLAQNPLKPAYRRAVAAKVTARPLTWREFEGGLLEIGHDGAGFAFDNEGPRHRVWLEPFALAARPVSCGEYLAFMEDGGYRRPEFWLSAGWDCEPRGPALLGEGRRGWQVHSFPACALQPSVRRATSALEAAAFAKWPASAAARAGISRRQGEGIGQVGNGPPVPTSPIPAIASRQARSEYNGKFMANQMVLRGGCAATPPGHARTTYRNFFPPDARWMFGGIRLAEDLR
jgi:ergothioneine biosynthesis protein EgtB